MLGTRRGLVPSLELFAYCHSISLHRHRHRPGNKVCLYSLPDRNQSAQAPTASGCGRKGEKQTVSWRLRCQWTVPKAESGLLFGDHILLPSDSRRHPSLIPNRGERSATHGRRPIASADFAVWHLSQPGLANEDEQAAWEAEVH